MANNYYDILGVSKSASKEEIKKAYRKLAHKHHPDKTKGDDTKFKEINAAYQILSSDKKRQEYDAYGRVFSDGASASGGQGFGGFDFGGGGQGAEFDINDIFENFFAGQSGRQSRVKRGRDISIDLEMSFEEAVFGAYRRVLLSKTSLCKECGGSGAEKGADLQKCSTCDGAGRVHETRKSFFGTFTNLKECSKCFGRGSMPSKKCSSCKGQGVGIKSEEVAIKVPPGIQDGEMIKLAGMGEAITNGIAGDLYVKIHVKRHPVFRREADNLLMDLDIKISEAILGIEKEISTLDGVIKLKIPAGIDSGEILRARGKGVLSRRGIGRGDLLIKVFVRTPRKISRTAKKLIDELKKEGL